MIPCLNVRQNPWVFIFTVPFFQISELFQDQVSLCIIECPETSSVEEAGLELRAQIPAGIFLWSTDIKGMHHYCLADYSFLILSSTVTSLPIFVLFHIFVAFNSLFFHYVVRIDPSCFRVSLLSGFWLLICSWIFMILCVFCLFCVTPTSKEPEAY